MDLEQEYKAIVECNNGFNESNNNDGFNESDNNNTDGSKVIFLIHKNKVIKMKYFGNSFIKISIKLSNNSVKNCEH